MCSLIGLISKCSLLVTNITAYWPSCWNISGLEQKICSLFVDKLDASGRIPVSGPDFVLDTIVEGAATDNNIVIEGQDSGGHRMHLTGGSSLEAFCAQLMRREISVGTMRQYCTARFYREGSIEGGLYTLSQSTRVTAFTGIEMIASVTNLAITLKACQKYLQENNSTKSRWMHIQGMLVHVRCRFK